MSKMDRMLNSKREKETIYEIYRACRLCGAGAGYKMPIIQNVIDLDDTDVELKQKIRECVQIEVHQDDKMPPLICELCVDKVNDFYEFLEMCRQTNKKTRLRLGLPPQSMPRGAPDAGECILGLTEPVYVNDDSDGEPLAKQKRPQLKVKVKKEPELKVKIEPMSPSDTRSGRLKSNKRPPTPPRSTRHGKHAKDDNGSSNRLQDKSSKSSSKGSPKVTPRSILKKDQKTEDTSLLTPRLKRSRDKEPVKLETPVKKVKIAMKPPPSHPTPKSSPKTSPRISRLVRTPKISPKRPPSPPRTFKCLVCSALNKTSQALASHMRSHTASFTNPKLSCNPCGAWFPTVDEASAHHRYHKNKSKPYSCRRCTADFKHLSAYDEHFENKQCLPWNEVADVKCDVCWHSFATNKLLDDHKCLGEDHRPGGKCSKCNRSYALLKNLKKHESNCTAKKKGELVLNPALLGKVRPIQVRVSRCDSLLTNIKQEHYDVSSVTADFGLDKNCFYPYISSVSSLRIKSEPHELDGMVAIKDEVKEEFCTEEDYVHWDSEDSGDSDSDMSCSLVLNPFSKKKRIDTLAALTLKTLFSRRCLGKVPRKRRRVKEEKNGFDSLMAVETEDDVTRDINNIIDNLSNDDDLDNENNKSGDGYAKSVDDFDSLRNDVSLVDSGVHIDEKNDDVNDVNDSANSSAKKINQNDPPNDASNGAHDVTEDEKDINGVANDKNDDKVKLNDVTGSNNDLSSRDSDKNDDLSQIEVKGTVNNGSINDISIVNKDSEVSNKDEGNTNVNEDSLNIAVESKVNDTDQNINVSVENEVNDDTIPTKNDEKTDAIEDAKNDFESQDSDSVGTFSESLLNDNTQSNGATSETSDGNKEINDKDFNHKIINDNATSVPEQISEINENKSQSDDLSLENLSQESKIFDSELNLQLLDSKTNDSCSTIKNYEENKQSDCCQDGRTNENSLNNDDNVKSAVNVLVNNDKRTTDSDDMDDTKLMEALDAQIGESNDSTRIGAVIDKNVQENDNFNDKIALEDLISSKNADKSMDLDIMPDEFNFDT